MKVTVVGLVTVATLTLLVGAWFFRDGFPSSVLDKLELNSTERGDLGPGIPTEVVAVLGSYRGRHTDAVKCIAVSPDGRWVASGSRDQTVRLWDSMTLKTIRIFKGAADDVDAVAFTADSKSLHAISGEGTLWIWNLTEKGTQPRTFPLAHWSRPFISTDATMIAFNTRTKNPAREYVFFTGAVADGKLKTNRGPLRGISEQPGCHVLSKSGRWLAVGYESTPNGEVYLWDLSKPDSDPQWILQDPEKRVNSIAFAPDETRLLVGRDDGVITLWELDEPGPIKKLELSAHSDNVNAITFSPDGTTVVSGGYDHKIVVWKWNDGIPKQLDTLVKHEGWIGALAFSPDGGVLYSASWDHTVRRWNAKGDSFEAVDEFEGHSYPVNAMAFSKDGRLLATGAISEVSMKKVPNSVHIWRLDRRQPHLETRLDGCESWVMDLTFSHDDELLAAASGSGVNCWNVRTLSQVTDGDFPTTENRPSAKAVAFAPDRRILACGWRSPHLALIDFSSQPPKTLISTDQGVYHPHISFAPNGQSFAMASEIGSSVYLIEPKNGELETQDELEGTDRIASIAWSPEGTRIASGHRDGTVHVWKLGAKNETKHDVLRGHVTVVASVDFGSEGRLLASGDLDGKLILWDVLRGRAKQQWDMPGRIWRIKFAPDGRHLAVGDGSGAVYILRLKID